MLFQSFVLASWTIGAIGSCVPDKYCQQVVSPLSYCRTWASPATCQGSTVSKCEVCGVTATVPGFSQVTTTSAPPRSSIASSTSSRLASTLKTTTVPRASPTTSTALKVTSGTTNSTSRSVFTTTTTTTTIRVSSSSASTGSTTTTRPSSASSTSSATTARVSSSSSGSTTTTRPPSSTNATFTTTTARASSSSSSAGSTTTTRPPSSTNATFTTTTARASSSSASTGSTTTTRPSSASSTASATTSITARISSSASSSPSTTTTTTRTMSTIPSVTTTTLVCEPDKYCQQLVGLNSYCRTWSSPASCRGSEILGCDVCGGSSSVVPSRPSSASSTSSSATTSTTAIMMSSSSTTSLGSTTTTGPSTNSTVTTWVDYSTGANTTSTEVSDTTSTLSPITTTNIVCVPDKFCQQQVGPNSYCRSWSSPATCQGSEISDCDICGGSSSVATTVSPETTSKSLFSSSSSLSSGSECESTPSKSVPMFLWVECPPLYSNAEFATFYNRLLSFVQDNCAGIKTTTLVIRVPHPYFPTSFSQSLFSNPTTSPLYTQFISKLTAENGNIKILLYPYLMDAFSRTQWVKFATASKAEPATGTMTPWDGVFSYVTQWQTLLASKSSSVSIDGFMVDYEEIFRNTERQHLVTITQAELKPYRLAYPAVKVATSVGYDDQKNVNMFAAYMDYLHLQVYDLYYPFAGADSTPSSIFMTYLNNPTQLAKIIMTHVFKSTVLSLYQKYPTKIYLMWSTQAMTSNCIYPLNSGVCGINNEFAWSPVPFNEFIQAIMAADPILGSLPHGIYTFNFVQPEWLPISSRPSR